MVSEGSVYRKKNKKGVTKQHRCKKKRDWEVVGTRSKQGEKIEPHLIDKGEELRKRRV